MPDLNLIHRIRLPVSQTPSPTIVMIHGWLGNEEVMWAFESVLPSHVVAVSPRAPFYIDDPNEPHRGYGWFIKDNDDTFEQGLSALHEFVTQLPNAYPVDSTRIVLMGFSQGAAMGVALTLAHPTVAAATVAVAGFLPPATEQWIVPTRLAGKPVFIAHGVEDATVPIAKAIQARDSLLACGAEVEYHEYLIGHKLNAQGMRDLKAWLAKTLEAR